MSDEKLYVRLKPYEPKAGYLVRRYIISGTGLNFGTDTGTDRPVWNIIPKSIVEKHKLADYLQPPSPHSTIRPPLFDILTEEEYQNVESRDRDLRLVQLGIMTRTNAVTQPETAVIDRTEKKGRDAAIPEAEIVPIIPESEPPEVKVAAPKVDLSFDEEDDDDTDEVDEKEDVKPTPTPTPTSRHKGRPRKRG